MGRYVEGADRNQTTLLPECLDDFIAEDNPIRVVDVFVDELDLGSLGFDGATPASTGRPSYHPAVLLKESISTAISTAYSQAVAWSGNASAMLN